MYSNDAAVESMRAAVLRQTDSGHSPLEFYLETCAKCGACAEVCPAWHGSSARQYDQSWRSDLIRRVYNRHNTRGGQLRGPLVGDLNEGEVPGWVEHFYSCTGCRRCAIFCPLGIDNSVIMRKGRAILDSMGLAPKRYRDRRSR